MTQFYNVQFVLNYTVLIVAVQTDDLLEEADIIAQAEEWLAADGINIRNWSDITVEVVNA